MAQKQNITQMLLPLLQSWGIDPREVLKPSSTYAQQKQAQAKTSYASWGRQIADLADSHLQTATPKDPVEYTSGTTVRLFSKDGEQGLFDNIKDISKYMSFDSAGNLKLGGSNPFSFGMRPGQSQLQDVLANWRDDALLRSTVESIYDGKYANSLFKDRANQPMSFKDFFAETQKLYEGELQEGNKTRSISGMELFKYMDKAQRMDALKAAGDNYADYITAFINNDNMTKQQQQMLTDTDQAVRQQVANYGVSGEPAPTGASGWGRSQVYSSERPIDTRRRGWSGDNVQGV